MHKWVFSMVKQFLPELLKKHIGDDAKITRREKTIQQHKKNVVRG